MALEVFWTKRADAKFDRILDYLTVEWGERVTGAFVKKVYDFLDILIEFPEIGSLENPSKNIRGFVIVKQITIFYKITGNEIFILNFFDNRRKRVKQY
jgi:plasmid stabilization system protein ParE